MEYTKVKLGDILTSISETISKEQQTAIFLNTSDISEGKFLHKRSSVVKELPGQAKKKIKNGDILFSEIRPKNKRYAVVDVSNPNDYVVSTKLMVLRIKDPSKYYLQYIYQQLISQKMLHQINEIAESRSGTFPQITFDAIKNIELTPPPLEEQKRIADIFTVLDDKIELNNQMNQTLEEIASLLYKRWFVDFEFPDDKGNPYKSSGGEMVDSELGMIPKGWEVKNLTEIAKFVNGLAMQKFRPQISEESLPVLKIKELISNSVSKSTERCKKNIKDEVKVFDGDIIFSWSGTLAVKIWSGGEAGLNQHLFKVTSSIYPKWLYYLIVLYNLNNFKSIASDKATTMGHINRSHLEKTYFTIPQIKIIIKEYTYMETIIDKIIENKLSIKYLQETKEKVMLDLIQI